MSELLSTRSKAMVTWSEANPIMINLSLQIAFLRGGLQVTVMFTIVLSPRGVGPLGPPPSKEAALHDCPQSVHVLAA